MVYSDSLNGIFNGILILQYFMTWKGTKRN